MKRRALTGSVYVALCQPFDVIGHDFLSGTSSAAISGKSSRIAEARERTNR
jgi:hypothetical protein